MSLAPGSRVGVYHVIGRLGAGGMGEVFRARDTTLDREVALKVLPPELSTEPARVTLLQREAKVLASLNHPNIGAIHGLEISTSTPVLVLERQYDVSPDGRRFLVLESVAPSEGSGRPPRLLAVLGWGEELRLLAAQAPGSSADPR